MKKTAYILTSVILIIVIWACSDYERTNPFDPGWGKPEALTKLELTAEKIDRVKIVWDDDYYSKDSSYTFQLDRKIGESGIWQEKYKIFTHKTNSFTDSSAGIAETNYYRIRVAYDENLSEPKESSIFTEFYPPAGISYVMKNLNTIQLNWSDNSNGEDGFIIDRFSGGSWADSIAVLAENSETWTDSAVVMNDSVQYRICAFRKGIYSDQALSPMINTKISAPGNFIYEFVNIYTIKFTWTDNSTGEDGFKIEKKVALGQWEQVASLPADSVTWTDNYAEVGEVLQYRIYAYKGSDTSDIVEAPGFNNPFPEPSNLVLNQMDLNTIRLVWSDNSIGEEGFKIDKRDSLGVWQYDIMTVGADVTTWTDMPTDIYDTLAYRVKAFRGYTTSNFSEATMNDIAFPPPTDLSVTRESLSRLKFDWTDNSAGEDGFVIDKKIDSDSWIISYGTVGSDVVTWTDSLANIDHDLQYRIYGRSGSNFSNYLVSDIIDNRIPAPSGLGYEKLSINSIRLNWTDNSIDEHGFTIDKAVNGNWTTGYASAGRNSVSWTDISAEINDDIVYRIRAYYSTDYSDAVDTGIITNTFPAPTNLTANATNKDITLNWTDNSNGEQGFIISKKYDGQVWDDNYATVAGNIVTWNETVADTGKYYYRVKAYYNTDQSAVSNVTETWIQQAENEMILVPAGTFQMGQVGVAEPVHEVTISHSFYMAKYETTQKEWTDIMGTNPAHDYGVGDNYPVYYVSWYDILVYCNKRSIAEGINPCYVINNSTDPNDWGTVPTAQDATWDAVVCRWYENGYRLPTEAEWEYAARYNDGRTYPWGEAAPDETYCNYNSNLDRSSEVGSYSKGNSNLGFCDLSGNMYEWVWDFYNTYTETAVIDPIGVQSVDGRVIRSSGFGAILEYIYSSYRRNDGSWGKSPSYGFRVAKNNPADPRVLTFVKTYGRENYDLGNSIYQLDDEEYIVFGESYGETFTDFWLLKTDKYGNKLWEKYFGDTPGEPATDHCYFGITSNDGSFLMTGLTETRTEIGNETWLIKTDENGNISWEKKYSGMNSEGQTDDVGYSVCQANDNGYAIASLSIRPQSGQDILILKTDQNGNLEWSEFYGTEYNDYPCAIKQTADNGYIIVGKTQITYFYDPDEIKTTVLKIDSNGNQQWLKYFSSGNYLRRNYVIETSDGSYIIASNSNTGDLQLIKIDSAGNKIWDKIYAIEANAHSNCVLETSDGGFVFTGSNNDITIIKTDFAGNEQWRRKLDLPAEVYFVNQTEDSGFILTGSRYIQETGKSDMIIIKTDENGNVMGNTK